LLEQDGQFVVRVKLEAEDQTHAIPQRLKQGVFVSCRQQKGEIGHWDALYLAGPALDKELPPFNRSVKHSLVPERESQHG
jgi:hypothetical protein